jgi:anti-sigma B factor antagonist
MELVVEEGPAGVTQAALIGRMDIDGAREIEQPFNVLTRLRRALVVDLSQVSFMASMGLRTLMVGARNQTELGGRLVLAGPQPNVEKVLKESGIGEIIGVYPSVEAAAAAITA